MYYSLSRLSALDIRWTNLFDASSASFRWSHANPYYQLIVASDAPVWIDVSGTRYELRTGESLLLLPWEQHTGWNMQEKQGTFYWVQFACAPALKTFDPEAAIDLNIIHSEKTELRTTSAAHEDLLILPKIHLPRQRFQLLSLFERLVQCSEEPHGYFRFQQSLLLGEILGLIAGDLLDSREHAASFSPSYHTYRRLVNLLNNGYEKEMSKERMEQEMDRKYEYLCQVFKKYAGITIVQYLHQLRIQRAKHLLLHSDKSVGDIAFEVGFQDAFYFSRIFKRLEGLSPLHFRTMNGEAQQ
ncbi:helix-turn-helix transcriptional regulator [Paenibacillus sp. 1P07SE]|uniref:helix-turn-helix transcriptional regulator n=1 Tax=Paenibacillus sp. 1P07SE TaxID=3132209 RepID=UPI0039A6303A